eukprot:364938-Chlamydomonas_euryale.AAC.20
MHRASAGNMGGGIYSKPVSDLQACAAVVLQLTVGAGRSNSHRCVRDGASPGRRGSFTGSFSVMYRALQEARFKTSHESLPCRLVCLSTTI